MSFERHRIERRRRDGTTGTDHKWTRMGSEFSIFTLQFSWGEGGSLAVGRGPWAVGGCAPAQIFRGRCARFFAHLRRGPFSFCFRKCCWFLGFGEVGIFSERDAQVFCARRKGTTTTRWHDGRWGKFSSINFQFSRGENGCWHRIGGSGRGP